MGGTFGSVVNSLMPFGNLIKLNHIIIAAGGGAGAKQSSTKDSTKDEHVGESVGKTQKII